MKLTPVLLTVAIAAVTMASTGNTQRSDDQIDPRSAALVRQAQGHAGAGRPSEAIDYYETALAVDPRNREAYLGLARVAQSQRLPGKAIRFYADALDIEPNDVNALAGQGEAYVQRGAVERARRNLTRVQELCGRPCSQATQLAAVIQRGPPVTTAESQPPVPPAAQPAPAPRRPN